ncbi:MAG: type II toxin-antitoxin system RelE/ParE family toxin [Chloroflexi bacterium]|nr:type II toxin-antitoxin system RelE/ParE family toxin [Chloroflexota bacterium]
MIQSFADTATHEVFQGRESRVARQFPQNIWPLIRRKLDMLNAAHILMDLRVPPGNRLEALKGDRSGRSSIRVNDQYRITFRFHDGNAYDVVCEDYH